jgi:hypothetical protein
MSIFVGKPPVDHPGARWPVEDQVAARHEAAHALAAIAGNMTIERVTLRETLVYCGNATPKARAVLALAGAKAAGSLGGVQSPADAEILREALADAERVASRHYPPGTYVKAIVRNEFEVAAKTLVDAHANVIKAIALALLERRTLTGDEVVAIAVAAGGERFRPKAIRAPVRLK